MQNALAAARVRQQRHTVTATPVRSQALDSLRSSPAAASLASTQVEETPNTEPRARVPGKRYEQSTPLPADTPVPTPGPKHQKGVAGEMCKRTLFGSSLVCLYDTDRCVMSSGYVKVMIIT